MERAIANEIAKTKVCPFPKIREALTGGKFCVPCECFYWEQGYGKLSRDPDYDKVGKCTHPSENMIIYEPYTGGVTGELW